MTIAPKTYRPNGFTLIELVIVILILGILAGIAAPKFFEVTAESEAATALTNVRTIFDAAEMFAAEHGRLPAEATPGDLPPDFVGYLPARLFTQKGPFNGYYDWDGPGTSADNFGVAIQTSGGPTLELRASYRALERLADDGSKDTGWITIQGGQVLFKLAPKVPVAPVDAG